MVLTQLSFRLCFASCDSFQHRTWNCQRFKRTPYWNRFPTAFTIHGEKKAFIYITCMWTKLKWQKYLQPSKFSVASKLLYSFHKKHMIISLCVCVCSQPENTNTGKICWRLSVEEEACAFVKERWTWKLWSFYGERKFIERKLYMYAIQDFYENDYEHVRDIWNMTDCWREF